MTTETTIPCPDQRRLNYLRNLIKEGPQKHFLHPWGGIILHGCDENGDLKIARTVAEYKGENYQRWVNLGLYFFEDSRGDNFHVYGCKICPEMGNIGSYGFEQQPENIFKCIHSLAADFLYKQEDLPWDLWQGEPDLGGRQPGESAFEYFCNEDPFCHHRAESVPLIFTQ